MLPKRTSRRSVNTWLPTVNLWLLGWLMDWLMVLLMVGRLQERARHNITFA